MGIGRKKAREIIEIAFGDQADQMAAMRSFRLTDNDVHKIRMVIQEWRETGYHKVEGDLRREISENIKR